MTELAAAYARWRSRPLGRITERLERDLVLWLAGTLVERRVLDAGTGDGTYAIEAAKRGARVVGLDIDETMLAAARERAKGEDLEIEWTRGSVTFLPFAAESFDIVLAVTVLCFVEEPAAALQEIARVLKPGGRLVLGELARWSTWAATRRIRGWLGDATWREARFFTRGQLRALACAAGLEVSAARGAIHFPKSNLAARWLGPVDPVLGRLHAPGAAFIAIAAGKRVDGNRGPGTVSRPRTRG